MSFVILESNLPITIDAVYYFYKKNKLLAINSNLSTTAKDMLLVQLEDFININPECKMYICWNKLFANPRN